MPGGLRTPVNEIALIPKIAALLALGKTNTAIAQELQVGFNTVRRIAGLEETKAMVKEIGDSALAVAKATIKRRIGENVELACEVLKEHIEKHRNLEAVKLVFKVSGVLSDEPVQQQGNQSLTVVLPGASVEQPKVIEVESESRDEEV